MRPTEEASSDHHDPSGPPVVRSETGGITTLTISRPTKLNALTPAVFVALKGHLDDLERRGDDVRCVIVRGAGRAFCAGHDLESIATGERAPSKHYEPEVMDQLAALPVPTIAQAHGYCLTGGLELALACDLIVAGASTKLGDTHGTWGLAPTWGMSVRLPERVGFARAKELMFTSRLIDAATALEIGLVDRCVPDDELATETMALAEEIVANSPGSNSIAKRLLAERIHSTPAERLLAERTFKFGLPADLRTRIGARTGEGGSRGGASARSSGP